MKTLIACIGLLLGGIAQAQFVPVTANYRETQEIRNPDGTQEYHQVIGKFYLSSDGSTSLVYTNEESGRPAKHAGQILSVKDKTIYHVNYDSHTASVVGQFTKAPTPYVGPVDVADTIGYETIDGHRCQIIPMKDQNGKTIGRVWHPLDLPMQELKEDTLLTSPSGLSGRVTKEWSNLQTGQDIDPTKFAISPDFQVLKPVAKKLP